MTGTYVCPNCKAYLGRMEIAQRLSTECTGGTPVNRTDMTVANFIIYVRLASESDLAGSMHQCPLGIANLLLIMDCRLYGLHSVWAQMSVLCIVWV